MKKGTLELIVYGTILIISLIFGGYQWYLDIQSKRAIIEIGKAQTQLSGEEYSIEELLKGE